MPIISTAPLCSMALWNRPFAAGVAMSVRTFAPPPDCPNTVTLFGSPPNAAMFSRTHSSAATMSMIPRLAEYLYCSPYAERSRNPTTLSRWLTDTTTTSSTRLRFSPS